MLKMDILEALCVKKMKKTRNKLTAMYIKDHFELHNIRNFKIFLQQKLYFFISNAQNLFLNSIRNILVTFVNLYLMIIIQILFRENFRIPYSEDTCLFIFYVIKKIFL